MQVLGQTHLLTQLLDIQLQTGQRAYLPGQPDRPPDRARDKRRAKSVDPDCGDGDDDIELVGVKEFREEDDDYGTGGRQGGRYFTGGGIASWLVVVR